jgi:hypothetical protein
MARKIDRVIAARVAGLSLAETAAAADCSVSTVQRILRDEEVQAAIKDEQRTVREATIREWTQMESEAREVLRDLLTGAAKEDVRLRAAVHILRCADDAKFTLHLMRRQAAIDEQIARDTAQKVAGQVESA